MSGVFWRAIGAMGVMVVAMAPCGVWAGGRLALLIGNQQYQTQPPLSTPVSDVNLMEATLKSQGFQVEKLTNLTKNQMDRAIQKFISLSQGKDIALFYYAGHGEQPLKGGRNFLLPTNADIRSDDDLETEAVLADDVVRRLEDAEKPARFRLVILDACRNNPKSRIRSGRGLAPIQTGDQYTLVGFSTNDRSPALDVATAGAVNSPYAQSLAHWLGQAGQLPLRTIFDRTASEVRSLTKDQQKPRVSGDFPGEVMLSGEVWQPTQPPPPVVIPPLPSAGQTDRQCIQNNQICFELAAIPTGTFQMGSPDTEKDRGSNEGPVHTVSVKGFWMGKTEVTQGLWKAVMGSNPSHFSSCGDTCPVEKVSWDDAQEFIKKLNGLTGKKYRLPSEAEWEYAARAGTQTEFSTGRKIEPTQANFDDNYTYNGSSKGDYKQKTVAACSYAGNPWGLCDMHGNVWEWVQDAWVDNYNGAPTDGSAREGNNVVARVLRGGSWYFNPQSLRSANRNWFSPGDRSIDLGFRLARTN